MDKCIHYWIIDSRDYGICQYCHAEKDFAKLQSRYSVLIDKAMIGQAHSKITRRKIKSKKWRSIK